MKLFFFLPNLQQAHSAPKLALVGLTQRNNISQPVLSEFDPRRRDSIPEEPEEDRLSVPAKPAKTKSDNIPPPPTYAEAINEHRKSWHSDDSTPTQYQLNSRREERFITARMLTFSDTIDENQFCVNLRSSIRKDKLYLEPVSLRTNS